MKVKMNKNKQEVMNTDRSILQGAGQWAGDYR